jgi:hypothetical protein
MNHVQNLRNRKSVLFFCKSKGTWCSLHFFVAKRMDFYR